MENNMTFSTDYLMPSSASILIAYIKLFYHWLEN